MSFSSDIISLHQLDLVLLRIHHISREIPSQELNICMTIQYKFLHFFPLRMEIKSTFFPCGKKSVVMEIFQPCPYHHKKSELWRPPIRKEVNLGYPYQK